MVFSFPRLLIKSSSFSAISPIIVLRYLTTKHRKKALETAAKELTDTITEKSIKTLSKPKPKAKSKTVLNIAAEESSINSSMADIRGFFGGGSAKKAKVDPVSAENKPAKSNGNDQHQTPLNITMVVNGKEVTKSVVDPMGEPNSLVATSSSIKDAAPMSPKRAAVAASASAGGGMKSPVKQDSKGSSMMEVSNEVSSDEIPTSLNDIITWKSGESIPYSALAETFERISKVPGRLEKELHFTKLFRAVILTTPKELEAIIYLSSNVVAPAYENLELGIGDSLLVKAVCEATGRNKAAVEADYQREGDLGVVALNSRQSQKTLSFAAKPKPLSAVYVLEQLRLITRTKGNEAQSRKVKIIQEMMIRCKDTEAKYIIRSLQGKLRIGTAMQTSLVAIAHAFVGSPSPAVQLKMLENISIKNHSKKNIFSSSSSSNSNNNKKAVVDDDDDDREAEETANEKKSSSSISMEISTTESVADIVRKLEFIEPKEAKKLRESWTNLSKEDRQELAVIVVKRAFSECPNLGILASALLQYPLYEIFKHCRLVQGVPIAPMLAKPTKEINEVLKRLSGLAFTMEYKYDGERAQVHLLEDGSVKIYSRNSEDNTLKYPDLNGIIKKAKDEGITSFVIDAEVVAFDREKGCLLPFQVLSTRKRKVGEDEGEDDQKVKVVLQAFDMLFINGKSLLSHSLRYRRDMLHRSFHEEVGFFYFASGADHVENGDTAPIESFMTEACAAYCEGLMVKTLDDNATYEPSKRSLNWLKLKKDYIEGMGVCDSVDLVVIGAYHGRGKRTNVYGAYLMACYDPDRDEFQSVCKVGTGFKDEDLIRLTEMMKPLILGTHKRPVNYNVGDPLEPDVWFQAKKVWELQAADLSKSSVHKGAIGRVDKDGTRGVGLRFPRFIREREDKSAEGATSAEQICEMFFNQGDIVGNAGDVNEDDDDEYL